MSQRTIKTIGKSIGIVSVALMVSAALFITTAQTSKTAHAAATITVNSKADTQADDGECTLREAITAANTDTASGATPGECIAGSGADTIEFAITGTADFTSGGQDGYYIQPTTSYPTITQQVTIDGYSQPGAQANTAVSPDPFNGNLLIKIDGSLMPGTDQDQYLACFKVEDTDNSVFSGLIVSSCGMHAFDLYKADNTQFNGNYIGVDETGLVDEGNGRGGNNGIGIYIIASNSVLIGGALPAQRNIVAGNASQDIYFGNEEDDPNGSSNITIKGNYIGLGADGVTGIPAGWQAGKGNAILLGHSMNDVIGGNQTGEKNVIASSFEYGVSLRDGCVGTTIAGNYIGTDYTGLTAPTHIHGTGNMSSGIHIGRIVGFTRTSHDVTVGGPDASYRNVISGNSELLNPDSPTGLGIDEEAYNISVENNYIGVGADGDTEVGNSGPGIRINMDAHDNELINNVVSGNGGIGIELNSRVADNTIKGNVIGLNASANTKISNGNGGIGLIEDVTNTTIGGTADGDENIIAGNESHGIDVNELSGDGTIIIGNYIGTNSSEATGLGNSQNGISIGAADVVVGGTTAAAANVISHNDGFGIVVAGSNAQNNTILRNSIHDNANLGIGLNFDGVTANDSLDSDSGPNGLLNYLEDFDYDENGGNTDLTYTLDVPAGNYRVEYFSNTTADASGHGEGQVFLGSQDITSAGGGSQSYTHTLTGTSIPNITATITVKDNSSDGFGATSEFSAVAGARQPVVDVSLTKTLLNPQDVAPGANIQYQLTVKNEGPDDYNLTDTATPFGSAPFLVDFAPTDLTAANRVGDGPAPGTYVVDVGNPDLTCFDGGPGSAGSFYGMTTHADYSIVICWYTGAQTTMPANQEISAQLDFTVASDSALNFTNYAITNVPTSDPDYVAFSAILGSGDELLDGLIANAQNDNPINNFAAVSYPVVTDSSPNETNNQPSGLAGTGQSTLIWIGVASILIMSAGAIMSRRIR